MSWDILWVVMIHISFSYQIKGGAYKYRSMIVFILANYSIYTMM